MIEFESRYIGDGVTVQYNGDSFVLDLSVQGDPEKKIHINARVLLIDKNQIRLVIGERDNILRIEILMPGTFIVLPTLSIAVFPISIFSTGFTMTLGKLSVFTRLKKIQSI